MVTFESLCAKQNKIAVIGLGYVGLPLAVHLSKHFSVVGFDLNEVRIGELKSGHDKTNEVEDQELAAVSIEYTCNPKDLLQCGLVIVAVPTPIDEYRIPNLTPLREASKTVGQNMAKGTCVVYESTVYPGATEEVCLPILEKESGLVFGNDFTIGYSPERINPGDKVHSVDKITKVVSGSDEQSLNLLAKVYGQIISAGIHKASSIKVAEAAKVIENTQRDLNIALMNELSMIFDKIGIDTHEVLQAAGTKWNFLPFQPGLVGGHCIGVDPYYLTFKAESIGYHPEMILAGRRINDSMGKYIANMVVKMLIQAEKNVFGAKIAILGLTFKENVPDLRNTKVIDIIDELRNFGIEVLVHDPIADPAEAKKYYGVELKHWDAMIGVDATILTVKHEYYIDKGLNTIAGLCKGTPILFDVKGLFNLKEGLDSGIKIKRL